MAKSAKKRGFATYRSYLWRDKDPIIDVLRTAVSDSRLTYGQIHDEGGPTAATLRSWFSGKTRRPQFTTVAATVRTVGKKGITFNGTGTPKLID